MEAQSTFGITGKGRSMNETFTRRIVEGFNWKILDAVDPNPKNFVGCAVYHAAGGKTGCLLRLEPNYEKKMYRITIRATQKTVPQLLVKQMEQKLSQGIPVDNGHGDR